MTNIAKELRGQIINSLSKAQLENIDAKGEATIEQEADKLVALFTATLSQLEGELPEKEKSFWEARLDTDLKHGEHIGHMKGFNDCLDTVHAKIKEIREGLK